MNLRVGVIGTGWVARDRHLPSFLALRGVDVVTVFDRDLARASATAERFGIPHRTDRLDEVLAMELDVVSIATPPWTHAELAIAALERGTHVFTEKPMAMSLEEAEGMVAAAGKADRLLCVSHNFRFSRAVAKADRFLSAAPEPRYAAGIQLSSLRRRLPDWYGDLPGGLLFDEVPHLVYLMHHFLGALEVDAVRSVPGGRGSEPASAEVLVRGERGPGQITMVFDAPVSEWQLMITTPRGVVLLDLFRDICVRIRPDRSHGPVDILRTSVRGLSEHGVGFVSSGARYLTRRQRWGHDALIGRFVHAVRGLGPLPVNVEEALGVVRVVDRIVAELPEREPVR